MNVFPASLLIGLTLTFLPACSSLKERRHSGSSEDARQSPGPSVGQNSDREESPRAKPIQLASATQPAEQNSPPGESVALPIATASVSQSTSDRTAEFLRPNQLSLADIEQLALAHNPTLAQADANVDAAGGGWLQAGLYPNPQIGYQGNEVGNNGAAGQQGIYVSQEIVRGNKLALSQHAAVHNVGRLEANKEAQRYRVLTSARIAFYELLIAQQRVQLANELVRIGEAGVKTTEALVKAKQVSKIDQLQAQVELNKARIILRQAENRKQAAWTELATNIGRSDWKMIPAAGSYAPAVETLDADAVMERLFASSPELSAARQNIARAHAALQRAQAEPTPNVTVQAGLQYDFGTHDPIANFQVGLPLPVRNRNQGNIQSAQSAWMAASRNVERLELALRNRLASVLEQYGNAGYQVDRYTKSVLPDAKESLNLVTEVYKRGEADYLRLLTAQRTYFQTELESLDAQNQWWRSKLQIDGLLLTGGLNAPQK